MFLARRTTRTTVTRVIVATIIEQREGDVDAPAIRKNLWRKRIKVYEYVNSVWIWMFANDSLSFYLTLKKTSGETPVSWRATRSATLALKEGGLFCMTDKGEFKLSFTTTKKHETMQEKFHSNINQCKLTSSGRWFAGLGSFEMVSHTPAPFSAGPEPDIWSFTNFMISSPPF